MKNEKTNFFPVHVHDFPADRWSLRRYKLTVKFLQRYFSPIHNTLLRPTSILDLGTENGLGNYMKSLGYDVINTRGEDFDQTDIDSFAVYPRPDLVTSFEIFEHLLNPFGVLKALPGKHLITSVPLRLWFAPAFCNRTNQAGRHFHEFERWQFDWLLEKAGWTIIAREAYVSPSFKPGIRTLLRWITPRYYIIYAVRK